MDYQKYLYTVYSSWLGKNIGIRLGAPVENFSSDQIEELYHGKTGYLVDYDIFASDDDSNGPLFFFRSLLDKDSLTSEDVANTMLGYIQRYLGFFWWGGEGVSTEHTAYLNLERGIKPPYSGSSETNGIALSEQIGGQIFSDCWGYLSLGDPDQAKDFAIKASCVTHDGNGIQGGIFVAVAIALAYQNKDIIDVINQTLLYLDSEMEYYRVVKVIMDFYYHHPDNWHDCLKFIQENYGYDKYPGVCHIIPNACVMIMALLYGQNDFSKTITIANQSGWDTDCNCGNLGSIMGALVRVDGIDESWIKPLNDVVNSSSCIGYLNIQTISESSKIFAQVAFKLKGIKVSDDKKFDLPFATKGFRGEVKQQDDKLLVLSSKVENFSYYLGNDLYDSRYDPSFSSLLYPNDVISFSLSEAEKVQIFVEDCQGNLEYSAVFTNQNEISYRITTAVNKTIHRYGIINHSNKPYYILDYKFSHQPIVQLQFANYPIDIYGPRYEKDYLYNLRGFVIHSGQYQVSEQGLRFYGSASGFMSTLCPCQISSYALSFADCANLMLAFNVKDYQNFSAFGLINGDICYLRKNNGVKKINILSKKYQKKGTNLIVMRENNDKIVVSFNEDIFVIEEKFDKLIVGLSCENEFDSLIYSLNIV
ncbi:MAG: ADP-ribosylglycohydrolase family protein [Erysipelotrichaceae bacterium]